jgi:DNA-binding CsgD family transcriptional regulator
MTPDRIAQLTEQQRRCLRLVFAHLTSKEISPHLGMEPASVDQQIKSAVRVLGASDRRAAARMLAEYEGREHLAHRSSRIAADPEPAMFTTPAVDEWEPNRHDSSEAVAKERAAFDAPLPARRPALPLPIGGGEPDAAGWRRRLAWIAAIAIGMALAIGVLVSALEALTRVVRN